VVNATLIEAGALDIRDGAVIGLVVETHCNYFAPLSFPQRVEAGLRVATIGRSSVRYEIGLFAADETSAAACGHFVHVYVDRQTRRPVDLPEALHRLLRKLQQPQLQQPLQQPS
jgi:acyl-CoA thioester hydrolase